jgi:beta-phosphoglucomutase-like phosphatase (HAD superfamily)
VLVDSEPIASRVLAEALSEIGFPLTAQQAIDRYTGISLGCRPGAGRGRVGARNLPADFVTHLGLANATGRPLRAELQPVSGAPSYARPASSLPRCVASSGALAKIRSNLSNSPACCRTSIRISSAPTMVARGKPAPDLFLHAAAMMAVPPARCVVIEDSLAGIRAARAAGMRAFGFHGGGHARPDSAAALQAAGATRVFSRLRELPGLLDSPAPAVD